MSSRRTARLRLEPIGPRHAGDLLRLHQDPAVVEWYGTWTADMVADKAQAFADGWAHDGVSKWMAYDAETDELVGRGGLSRVHVDGADRLEVGWIVAGHLWGNGYAAEIGRAALSFAFDELGATEVVAYTEPDNERSRAVMDRVGMTYDRDIVHDDLVFVLYTTSPPPAP